MTTITWLMVKYTPLLHYSDPMVLKNRVVISKQTVSKRVMLQRVAHVVASDTDQPDCRPGRSDRVQLNAIIGMNL
jgi:hypothetical protein